jgi:hypothetical protein
MTVSFIPGKARRAGLVLGAVSAGLLVLSACDKPTPLATVTVGTDSVHTEASCYNDSDSGVAKSQLTSCLNKAPSHTISVNTDDQVRFGVDPAIADAGWTIFLNGNPAESQPSKRTYRSIPAADFFQADQQTGQTPTHIEVAIVSTKGQAVRGVWSFELKQKES